MGHGDVTVIFPVDFIHHPAEDSPVRRCVTQVAPGDVVVYHLVDYDIVPLILRQVKFGTQSDLEIDISVCPNRRFQRL